MYCSLLCLRRCQQPQVPQPETVVDRLAAAVSNGGHAAENLGRLAGTVSSQLGYRALGSTSSADSSRSYLSGTAQDPDLRAAEGYLGGGREDDPTSAPTPNVLRRAGQILSRQASTAFEAMAAAAENSQGDSNLLSDVINNQLGPMPRLLENLATGCSTLTPARGSGGNTPPSTSPPMLASLGKKRAKEELTDGNERPQKKATLGDADVVGSAGGQSGSVTAGSEGAGASDASTGVQAFTASENGGGASLSPATAAPPASNLLARPATANFRHEGGEKLMAVLRAKVGRLFSLDAEYTHVRRREVSENGGMATLDNGSVVNGGVGDASDGTKAAGVRRVLSRLKATRAGQFVVNIQFDVAGNEFRPCDVSVLSWAEAEEADSSKSDVNSGIQSRGDQWMGGSRNGSFLQTMEGSKPWRTSSHAAFARVSSHAFKVSTAQTPDVPLCKKCLKFISYCPI